SQGFDELGWVGNIGILHSDRSSILRWWRHSRLIDGEHSEFVFTVLDQVVHIDLGRMTQSHIDTLPVHGTRFAFLYNVSLNASNTIRFGFGPGEVDKIASHSGDIGNAWSRWWIERQLGNDR